MKKYGIFLLLFLLTILTFTFCSREDSLGLESSLELQSPYGNWILERFIAADKIKTQWSTVPNFSSYYLLTLNKGNTFTGTTSSNKISGSYIYDASQRSDKLSFSEFSSSNAINKENSDGDLYLRYLKAVKYYRVFYDSKKEAKYLRLYLTDEKDSYLEYKGQISIPFNKK